MNIIQKADPRGLTSIELGVDACLDRLYGCFRVNNPKIDGFSAERDVEIVYGSGRKIKIHIPEHMRVDLPIDKKLVNSEMFSFEEIRDNGDSMHLLTMRAGWNQTETDINRMIDLNPSGSFVAKLKGEGFDFPVGTASAISLGENHSWIGMILVHPELRRQGVANYMMQECLNYAVGQGKVINGLDATPMGNSVYKALGYVDSFRIWKSFFPLAQFANQSFNAKRVKPVQENDLDELIRYDAAHFLERGQILGRLFGDSKKYCFVHRHENGNIGGYVFARPGRLRPFIGPLIADRQKEAQELLVAVSHALLADGCQDASMDIPESKFHNPAICKEGAFEPEEKPSNHLLVKKISPVRHFIRMYQAVDCNQAEVLAKNFAVKERLAETDPRVRRFGETLNRSVYNYSETMAFLEYEKKVLQQRIWSITGPEKG